MATTRLRKTGHTLNVKASTKPCFHCGKGGTVDVDSLGIDMYVNQGWSVQDAFPEYSADVREQIISGIHPECWKDLFDADPELGDTVKNSDDGKYGD